MSSLRVVFVCAIALVTSQLTACWVGNDSDPSEDTATTVRGTIEVVIMDVTSDAPREAVEEGEAEAEHTERIVVYLTTEGGDVLELELADGIEPSFLTTGDRVIVTGELAEGGIIRCDSADDVEIQERPLVQAAAGSSTTRKVAVILFNFQNDTSEPLTPEHAKERIFTATTSANAFFKEASFGQLDLAGVLDASGDVFGWYTIADDNTGCDTGNWRALAAKLAEEDGNDLSGYTNHMFVFPGGGECGWAGVAAVGGTWSYVKAGYMGGNTAAHELGHNFGLSHASTHACTSDGTPVTLSTTCTTKTYGDPFDTMASNFRDFSGYHKARLGWLAESNIKTITEAGTHVIDLTPLGAKTSETQVLRVPRVTQDEYSYYYVEFRQPTPVFDNFVDTHEVVNGLSIRMAPDLDTRKAPLLLDMHPATSTFRDAPLAVGATYTDVESAISIQLISRTAAGARVRVVVGQVTPPPPDTTPPFVSLTAPTASALVTGNVALSAGASDNRGVTRVDFTVDGQVVGSDTLSPFTFAWSSAAVADGAHTIGAQAYDAAGNMRSATTRSITVDNAIAVPELVANGGFEATTLPWTSSGNAYRTTTNARTGTGYVFLGATQNASGSVAQTITIPSGAARSLRFWLNVTSNETTKVAKYDRLYVEVRSTTGTLLKTLATYSNLDGTFLRDYRERVHSLAEFTGQTVIIQFRVVTNESNTSWFRIDDVTTL